MNATAIISAVAGLLTAAITAWFAFRATHGSTRVQEIQTVMDGYTDLVENLRMEVDRLREQIAEMNLEMTRCEQRNLKMAEELATLKKQFAQLERKRGAT